MADNNFNDEAGLVLFIPKGPPSFESTLSSTWGCKLSFHGYNCYSYALDIPDHGPGSPGWLYLNPNDLWHVQHASSSQALHRGLLSDGLMRIEHQDISLKDHVIAAFIKEAEWGDLSGESSDFHFYRLDDDGVWSHKRGKNREPKKIAFDDPRADPESSVYEFVGFYKISDKGIRYWQKFYWDPDNILDVRDIVPSP